MSMRFTAFVALAALISACSAAAQDDAAIAMQVASEPVGDGGVLVRRWLAGGTFFYQNPTTRSSVRRRLSATSAGARSLATMNSAMSPTTFEVGVTLTMSPNSWFTSA